MTNQRFETVPSPLPSVHDQITRSLKLVHSAAHRITQKLTHLQHQNRFNREQILEAEARIDQLLAKLKESNPLLTDQNARHQEPVADPTPPEEIEQLRRQLQQRSGLLRQSAHDLKSNFGIILSATSLLAQSQTDAKRQQMLDMLRRNLGQANQLINQLLDVTRLEAGEERRQLTTFDVADLLGGLIESIRPLADEKCLWVQKQGVDSLLIESDYVKLYRIAQNLLLNAIKHTKLGGITLGWESGIDRQEWYLTITDTGPGLPGGSHRGSGEGIGLLIVRQLCTLLDAQLSVEEPNGAGTRFIVTFPLRYSNPAVQIPVFSSRSDVPFPKVQS
ncbi:sensor histidine kinase [Larkinella terrae]|uniref:histidine kinase n=1 Tax=Larkinella terrae TaxID=2025311 RepID=A0A7K0EVB8_9BACT|nr:HAMP domain-containing sensor histidine kinase [Larkinella terrae]MRS65764.1 hypothetical protein [Larkinella terrae]